MISIIFLCLGWPAGFPFNFLLGIIEFDEISGAEMYQLLTSESLKTDWFEGAEDINNLKVQTDSITSNSFIVEKVEENDTKSFHLVNSGDNFQIINKLVPSETSILKFDNCQF